jgi:hypothetical protein
VKDIGVDLLTINGMLEMVIYRQGFVIQDVKWLLHDKGRCSCGY